MIPDKLLTFAFSKLDELDIGQELSEKNTKNWSIFIQCAKQYQDINKNLLFSFDYKEIRKTLTFDKQIESEQWK